MIKTTTIKALFIGSCLATITLSVVQRARATLGESVDSVESAQKVFKAVQHATLTRNGYTVREFKSEANVMREYISPSGVVFAIAWNGLSHPDLTSQLGTYAGEFHIGNATNLFNSASNSVFAELGGSAPPGSGFDWGLPFFFGRSVYVGIEGGKSSILGSGPYWAY